LEERGESKKKKKKKLKNKFWVITELKIIKSLERKVTRPRMGCGCGVSKTKKRHQEELFSLIPMKQVYPDLKRRSGWKKERKKFTNEESEFVRGDPETLKLWEIKLTMTGGNAPCIMLGGTVR